MSLSLQTLLDDGEFQADQAELDTLDFKSDLQEDYVMVRRLAMTRGDAIRNTNMQEKVSRLCLVCCLPCPVCGGDGERCRSTGGLMFADVPRLRPVSALHSYPPPCAARHLPATFPPRSRHLLSMVTGPLAGAPPVLEAGRGGGPAVPGAEACAPQGGSAAGLGAAGGARLF